MIRVSQVRVLPPLLTETPLAKRGFVVSGLDCRVAKTGAVANEVANKTRRGPGAAARLSG
jgi:hypothetical protein